MTDRTQHIDYEAAVKARAGFREASAELMTAGNNTDDPHEAMTLGVAAHACDVAGAMIFEALNMLSSYTGDQEAERVIHFKEWEPAEPTYVGMTVKADERMPQGTAAIVGKDGSSRTIIGTGEEEKPERKASWSDTLPEAPPFVTFENKAEPVRLADVVPAFVTERVDTCLWELEAAVAKAPVLANAKVGQVHGTSDGGWRVEVRVNDQVFAPRFDTLDKATEYRREAAEIVERAA